MLLKTLGLSWIVCVLQICEQAEYKNHLCRYHYHYTATTWAGAREICEKTNRTLLIVDSNDEMSNITNVVIPQVTEIAAGKTSYISDISSLLWIGLHQETNPVRLLLDNCTQYTMQLGVWNPGSMEGCVILNTTDQTYVLNNCDDTQSFICEDNTEDDGDCFDVINIPDAVAPIDIGHDDTVDIITGDTSCEKICMDDPECAAFQSEISTTKCYKHFYGSNLGLKNGRPPTQVYMKNLFIRSDTPLTIAPVISDYYCPEPSSSSVVLSSTVYSSDIPSTSPSAMTVYHFSSNNIESSTVVESSSGILPTTVSSSGLVTTSDVDAGSTSSSCYCPCTLSLASSTITTEELQAKIEQMQTELTVNRKETSSYKRKLTSAPDDRVSAKSIGYVGVVILTVVTGLLVCIDLPTIMKDSLAFFKRCHSYCCKK